MTASALFDMDNKKILKIFFEWEIGTLYDEALSWLGLVSSQAALNDIMKIMESH